MIKNVARKTFRVSYLLVGIVLITLALCTIAARVGLPLLANHKGAIEQRVSEYLKSPVSIGELQLRWTGSGPVLYASDVAIQESAERNVTLDELHMDIDVPTSFMYGQLQIKELRMVGADLVVEADGQGQFQLHGVAASRRGSVPVDPLPVAKPASGVDVVSWLFKVQKFALLDTQITLLDRQSNQRLVMDELNILVDNTSRLHRLRIFSQLPASLGGAIEIGVDLQGSAQQLSELTGKIHAKVDDVNLQATLKLLNLVNVPDTLSKPLVNIDADAAFEFWGTWQEGQLSSLRGPVTLANLQHVRSGETLLDSVVLELEVANSKRVTEVVASNITLSLNEQKTTVNQVQFSRKKSGATSAAAMDAPTAASSDASSTDSTAAGTTKISADITTDSMADTTADTTADSLATTPQWELQASSDSLQVDLITSLLAVALTDVRPELSATLHQADISGSLNDVSLAVRELDSLPSISLSANTNDLQLMGSDRLPEVGPLSGKVSLVNSKGTVELRAEQTPFSWPAVSDQQLTVDRFSSIFDIDLRNNANSVVNGVVQLNDDGIETNTTFKVDRVLGAAPHLDIRSRFAAADVAKIKAWLPEKYLGAAATSWIDKAIVGGEAKEGQLLLFGNIDDFPFRQGEGVFRASVDIDSGTLAFLPDWPAVSQINGTLELDGLSISGVADKGVMGPFNFTSSAFAIENLSTAVLELSGTAAGSLQDLTDFAVNGPLAEILGPAMEEMSATGNTQMDLALTVPLFDQPAADATGAVASSWKPFKINGSVFLEDNDITFGRAGLVLTNAAGSVGFNETGVAINKVEGEVLAHRVRLAGKTVGVGNDGTTTISLSGVIEANDLLAHYENPLDQFIRGASLWDVSIKVPHSGERLASEGVQLDIRSDLVGSQLLLPAPYNKPSSTSVPFHLSTQFRDSEDLKQQWRADYGNELHASVNLVDEELQSVLLELSTKDSVESGALVVEAPVDLSADSSDRVVDSAINQNELEGIHLQGHVSSLVADGWIETAAKYIESLPAGDEENPTPILPITAALTTDALILGRTSFGKATLEAGTEAVYLNVDIQNQFVQGSLQYPRNHWEQQTPLKAQLDLLDWSVIEALEGEESEVAVSGNSTALDPRLLPPIEASLAELRRGDVRLRNLAMRTEPNVSGMDITALGFAYDTMRLVGRGYWYLTDPQQINVSAAPRHVTQLNLVLQGSDFGTGLDSLGLDGILDDTQGSVDMQLNWPGALYLPDLASLDGTIDLDLQAGSIVPLEPGAGKVVGLFSLQALPRRLNLDFKDITADGLAFTRIAGSATIENGVVDTPLLQLTGPIGVVDIAGTSDLSSQELNQQITVLPRVSAALPIIGAISGGASAGIGALVAAGFLKAIGVDFDRIGLRTYQLSGQWTAPVMTPIPSDFLGRR